MEYDEKILKCFLDNQLQLFPKIVVNDIQEAEDFLNECMAVVCNSIQEVWDYFDENGMDVAGMDENDIADAAEVFNIGDGRYLVVEA